MTIRKYLGCDGPECISNLEVSLESPLRDILPGNWTAIMIPGDQKQDYHFCSDECLAKFCIARYLKGDGGTDEGDASGDREPKEPKPSGDLDSAAVKPIAGWIDELLRQAMVGPYNPPKTYTYTWPDILKGGGVALYNRNAGMASGAYPGPSWDAGPYMRGEAGALSGYTTAWPKYTDTAGTVLR